METVTDFILGSSKITVDIDCSHEIKRHLLLGRKNRDTSLPTKVCKVKARVFPVVMYKCEKWTIKKVEIEEQMRSNYDAGEGSLEFLGLRGDQISQS